MPGVACTEKTFHTEWTKNCLIVLEKAIFSGRKRCLETAFTASWLPFTTNNVSFNIHIYPICDLTRAIHIRREKLSALCCNFALMLKSQSNTVYLSSPHRISVDVIDAKFTSTLLRKCRKTSFTTEWNAEFEHFSTNLNLLSVAQSSAINFCLHLQLSWGQKGVPTSTFTLHGTDRRNYFTSAL